MKLYYEGACPWEFEPQAKSELGPQVTTSVWRPPAPKSCFLAIRRALP